MLQFLSHGEAKPTAAAQMIPSTLLMQVVIWVGMTPSGLHGAEDRAYGFG